MGLKPADCCDSDACRTRYPAVSPYSVTENENGLGIIARYRCPRCGFRWFTGWSYALIGRDDPWSYA